MAHFIDFHIGGWKVGSIGNSSGVFVGQNLQYGWHASSKQNQASRNITGDNNQIEDVKNEVMDPDYLDCLVEKAPPYTTLVPPSPVLMRLLSQRRKHQTHKLPIVDTKDWDW